MSSLLFLPMVLCYTMMLIGLYHFKMSHHFQMSYRVNALIEKCYCDFVLLLLGFL